MRGRKGPNPNSFTHPDAPKVIAMPYQPPAALASYVERIGATQMNFRRWIVREQHGNYYREVCVVKIGPDGTITVSEAEYQPTEAEAAAIRLAYSDGSIVVPTSTEARPAAIQDLVPLMRLRQQQLTEEDGAPIYYEFFNQRTGNLQMVHQRVDMPNGVKKYLPWSFWNDGEWRSMEPDGDLPFWKPRTATDKKQIMVHEGAKAAQHVTEMCEDTECTHPWIETLREFEHWGMIGGALSPHRAAYKELWDRELDLLVYVCDNDRPGKDALEHVSRKYRRRMKGIYFDHNWPVHWDMADEMPPNLFSAAGRYIGKQLDDLIRNCTWATDLIPPPPGSKARPSLVINRYFAEEWHHIRTPEVFVHESTPRHFLNEKEFNGWVRPYSDTEDTAKIFRRKDTVKATSLRYIPHVKGGMIKSARDEMFFNTHEAPIIKAEAGDCRILEEYFVHTFPKLIDRNEVIRWAATLVCHPEIKMGYGLLLVSEMQGVGKSTLGSDILKPLVGEWNVSEPSEQTVVDTNFNGWCAHKRLAVIHEIYAGHSSKAYDKLKSIITEKSITVNEKYQAEYSIENWLHVIACSNSKRALKLSMDDRRWFVPQVTEAKRPKAAWDELHNWLNFEGGFAKAKWWFAKWLAENGGPVEKGTDAPDSAAKQEVVIEGYSPGQMLAHNLLERLQEEANGQPIVFPDVELQRVIKDQIHEGRTTDRLERAATLRKVAKGAGWYVNETCLRTTAWPIVRGQRAYVITNDPNIASMLPSDVIRQFPTPFDIVSKARVYFGQM